MTFFADMLALAFAAVSALYAHIAGVQAKRSGQNVLDSAKFARRCAECAAREQEPLEVDRGAPHLRVVHIEEARERLIDAAVQRHPAGRRAESQMSPSAEEIVPPAHADALHAPGCAPKS